VAGSYPILSRDYKESGLPVRLYPFSPPASGIAPGASLGHLQIAASEILGIEFLDRLKTFFSVGHFDESESLRPIRTEINHHLGTIYFPVGFKQGLEFAICGIEGQVSHVNSDTHLPAPKEKARHTLSEGATRL
jgi:hypothetical protein